MADRIPDAAQRPGRLRFRSVIAFIAIVAAVAVALASWGFRVRAIPDPDPPDPNARHAEMVVGTWVNFHHGERTMTVRPDGTATMVIVLTGLKAYLFTPRLELEMVWSIEDGCMNRRNTGGNPPEKVEFVNRTYGDRVAERILELTDDRMVLQDDSQGYEWRRVE